MADRGVLWLLTVLFIVGAAGRWEGPAAMLGALLATKEAAPPRAEAARHGADRTDPGAEELAALVLGLSPEEGAAILSAIPPETRARVVKQLPPERLAALPTQ